MVDQKMYCGKCFSSCATRKDTHFKGMNGHWQQYGDFKENEKRWVFLCQGCSRLLWRLYSKDEPCDDWNQYNKEYMVFLKEELSRTR